METLWAVVAVLLALGAAGPAPGRVLYVHEDGPPAEPRRQPAAHRRHYIGSVNPANMKLVNERAIDSYFRVLRPSPPPVSAAPAATTQPPQPDRHAQNAPAPSLDRDRAGGERGGLRHDEQLYNQNRREYFRKHSVYEKHTVVSRGNKRTGRRPLRPHSQSVFASQAGGEGGPYYGKEYRKRNTVDREPVPHTTDQHRNPVGSVNAEDAYTALGRRTGAPYALFYRTGGARSHVDLNVGRKGASYVL